MESVPALFDHVIRIVMVLMRVGALWSFFPIFGQNSIPRPVRMAGAVTLAVALLPTAVSHLPAWTLARPPLAGELVLFALREFAIGAGMGLAARWIFSVVMTAAHWAGMQMGFSAGGALDPEFQGSDTSWAEFHQWIGMIIFFGIGGHLFLIQALGDSYQFDMSQFGTRLMDPQAGGAFWIEVGSRFFSWMLRLAGPVVVVLLVIQAALGILSKFIPQINVWTVSIPVTIGAGVVVFALLSPMYGDALASLFNLSRETTYLWLKAVGVR